MAGGNYREMLKRVIKKDFSPRDPLEYFSPHERLASVFDKIPAWIRTIDKGRSTLMDRPVEDIPLVKPDTSDRFLQFQGIFVPSDGNTIEIGRDSRKWSKPRPLHPSVLIGFLGVFDGSEKHIQYRIARVFPGYALLLADPDLPTGYWINVEDIMPESYLDHIRFVEQLLEVVREKAMHFGGPDTGG
jgi:hypothetical protein